MSEHRIEETVARGICIGCGACSAATHGKVSVTIGRHRLYQADISQADEVARRAASRVCPFSDESPNEDELRAAHGDELMSTDRLIGQYSQTFAGRVTDEGYLQGSSSGALTSWLARQLLERGMVDRVLAVGRAEGELASYDYAAFNSTEAVTTHRKSYYYANTMAEVLSEVERFSGRVALVGIPCFIRAARSLTLERPELKPKIAYYLALVCGHYKTQAFAESLAWQVGVPPERLAEVDFRVKIAGQPSNDYAFGARAISERGFRLREKLSLDIGVRWLR